MTCAMGSEGETRARSTNGEGLATSGDVGFAPLGSVAEIKCRHASSLHTSCAASQREWTIDRRLRGVGRVAIMARSIADWKALSKASSASAEP